MKHEYNFIQRTYRVGYLTGNIELSALYYNGILIKEDMLDLLNSALYAVVAVAPMIGDVAISTYKCKNEVRGTNFGWPVRFLDIDEEYVLTHRREFNAS